MGAAASNYAITEVNGTLTVNKAPLIVEVDDSTRLYGSTNPGFTASYVGLVNNDASTVISNLAFNTAATTGSSIGTYAINASGGSASNYLIGYISGTLSITPAPLTIAANNASRTYGATNPAFSASYNGLVAGDTSTVVSGLTLNTTATTGSSVGSYAISGMGAAASNYAISYVNGTLTVGQAALTITANDASRTYGATNPAFSASYNGLVAGNTSSVISGLALSTAATTGSSVGTYAISGMGAAASNYAISYVNGTLTVGQAALTITANDASRTYGATNPSFSASYTGLTAGDTSSVISGLTLGTVATTGSSVGTYAISGMGAAASNYAISYVNGTLTVGQAALTITANDASRTYGATNPAFSASYNGLTAGDTNTVVSGLALSTAATTGSSVGTYTISGMGAVASNYAISYVNGTLTVGQAALTITANNASRTYGATNPSFSASYNGLTAGDTSSVVSGLTLGTAATTGSSVGSYTITALGATASNYAITEVNGTLTVGQAALTITANDASRMYGSSNPAFSASYAGLVAGDTSSVVSGLALGTAATTTSNVGSYAITGMGAAASNYAISYVNGTLAVTKAPLVIEVGDASRTYGATNPAFTATYIGLVAGNTSSVISGLTLGTAATTGSSVGSYAINGSGAIASNYLIGYAPGTLTVGQASLTITANDATRTYGSSNPAFTASYNGLVAGDTSSVIAGLSLGTAATTGSNVGSYAIAGSGGVASNYAISYVNGTLAVTPAALTITANDAARLYGASDPTFTASYNGLVAGDTSAAIHNVAFSSTDTSTSPLGTYTINVGGGTNSNYTISFASGHLVVAQGFLTIIANDASRLYGASDPAFSASYAGFVGTDNPSLISGLHFVTTETSQAGIGTYSITGAGASIANYAISYVFGTLTVTPAPLTVAVNNTSRTYGSADPTFTSTVTGLQYGQGAGVVTGLTYAATDSANSSVGSYIIAASGGMASNYTLNYVNGALSVNPAVLTVTAGNASRLATQGDPAFTYTSSGYVLGDTAAILSGVHVTASDFGTPVNGVYAITPFGGSAANYTITYVNGALTVTGGINPITLGNGGSGGSGSGSILSQIVTNQISQVAAGNALVIGNAAGINAASEGSGLQYLINFLGESSYGSSSDDKKSSSNCLKTGSARDGGECAAALTIRGY